MSVTRMRRKFHANVLGKNGYTSSEEVYIASEIDDEITAANARIAELEQEKADVALRMATWAANTLHTCHEQCERPLCVANRRIAALEALLGEAPHTWACHKVMSVDTETGAPIHLSDRVGCSCFKSRA